VKHFVVAIAAAVPVDGPPVKPWRPRVEASACLEWSQREQPESKIRASLFQP